MNYRFYNAKILTMETADIITGELWVQDDKILYVGKGGDAAAVCQSLSIESILWDREIDCNGNLLMPGFKNAHTHSAMTFLRSKTCNSWPFDFSFDLFDKAKWLDEILASEELKNPIIIGQSMGGYVGQAYAQLFPEKLKGFISIDSAPLQREYVTALEIWLLKRMEPVYRHYPWKWLLQSGTKGIAVSPYGRKLMYDTMMEYDGQQERYAKLSGHGFRMLAEAMEKDLPYRIPCPALLICGEKDHAGSCIRYNKAWHKKTGIRLEWIQNAGHNSNTDAPRTVNHLIEELIIKCDGNEQSQ